MAPPIHASARTPGAGVAAGAAAYMLWGLIPLYFKLLKHVPPLLVLGHRITWSLVLLLILIAVQRRWAQLVPVLRSRRTLALLAASTVALAVNWFVFIWAVAADRVVEASLGYFINPLMSVALGVIILRERLRAGQTVALALAAIAVTMLAVYRGTLPWVPLALAGSFGLYGLFRKLSGVAPVIGVAVETALLLPVGSAIIFHAAARGAHPADVPTWSLLLALGLVTSVPLLLFAAAANALRLITLGFLQYLCPTCQFLLAVLVFSEPFSAVDFLAFAGIWLALAIFTADTLIAFSASMRNFPQRDIPAPGPAGAGVAEI